jgi:putative acetyltransferase
MNSYVAVCDDRVIGFSSLDVHQGELDYLYVDPEFAGQGIARRLTARVEREAVRNGLEDLALTASINALPAYERLGYHRVSNFEKTIRGVPIPCVRMTKHLGGNR